MAHDSATQQTPEGTPVYVIRDDGSIMETITQSEPWQLGHGGWVVLLAGIRGGYDLSRVHVRSGPINS